ncbi:hypothetical protein F5Y10DRAFT_265625 [Nemania abortiva]|nr:hypothetical protein F5Y10DRAFT_265625 [Nemania abortiva]
MGHQESSPPRQRQRVPHHRHHRHHSHYHRHPHGHTHYAAAQTPNHESAWSLGRLNRGSHAPDSHVVVESWLEQVTAPVPTTRMGSPESRNQPGRRSKRPRSKDRQGPSWRQHARRVDPLWRPQHIPPAQGSSPPRLPLPTRNPKRYKRDSHDSSLISDLSPLRGPRKRSYVRSTSERAEDSRHYPLDEAEVGATSASSPTSHVGAVPTFEKRPRYKTRADKYETKKSGDRKKKGEIQKQGRDRPRKPKSGKKKHIPIGKNVMNNFTSEAVLNDRITVQPNLKPGLFSNKRVSKKHPVTDLSFSEMPFPAIQERDAQKHKGLSSSRLREVRREGRELEHISSFFQPTCLDATSRKRNLIKRKDKEETRRKTMASRDNVASFTIPSSPTVITQSCSIPPATSSKPSYQSGLSRETAYFTWSTSQNSPEARRFLVSTQLKPIERTSSATPESIREALISTGVYKDTGLRLHGISNDQQRNGLETYGELSSTHSGMTDHVGTYGRQASTVDQVPRTTSKCSDTTRDTMTSLANLEGRWNTILPPEWRLHRSSEAGTSVIGGQRQGAIPDKPTSVGPPSRQEIVQEARIKPIRELPQAQHVYRRRDGESDVDLHSPAESCVSVPQELGQAADQAAHAGQDRDTIASREAMPPPPLPPLRSNSLHLNSYEPEDDSSSAMHTKTARPLETPVQVSDYENPQIMDTYKAISQPHEVSRIPEKVIPTLGSASWMPQVITSGIASYERDKTLSRLSMRSPIYEVRSKEKENRGATRSTSPLAAPVSESMADFIARIESELEESAPLNENSQLESTTGCQEFHMGLTTSAHDTHSEQLTASDESRIGYCEPSNEVIDTGFRDAFETDRSFHEYERLASSTPMPTETSKDDTDEFLEMSRFWRPNPFSHF